MAFLYGGAKPACKDSLRDYQRKVAGSARGMEREIRKQDVQDETVHPQKLFYCIKKTTGSIGM